MPVPQIYNVTHYRGDTLTITMRLWEDDKKTIPADPSGAAITSQVRATPTSAAVLGEFDPDVSGNTITLTLTALQTQTMPAKVVYDVQLDWLSDGTKVETPLSGAITFAPDVTRVESAPDETMV